MADGMYPLPTTVAIAYVCNDHYQMQIYGRDKMIGMDYKEEFGTWTSPNSIPEFWLTSCCFLVSQLTLAHFECVTLALSLIFNLTQHFSSALMAKSQTWYCQVCWRYRFHQIGYALILSFSKVGVALPCGRLSAQGWIQDLRAKKKFRCHTRFQVHNQIWTPWTWHGIVTLSSQLQFASTAWKYTVFLWNNKAFLMQEQGDCSPLPFKHKNLALFSGLWGGGGHSPPPPPPPPAHLDPALVPSSHWVVPHE